MKFHEVLEYDGADLGDVYDLVTSQEFRSEACAELGATEYEVTVEPQGDGHQVSIIRTVPSEMPDFIKKLTGNSVKVKQTEKWGRAAADGSRDAEIKVSIIGQPAELLGTARLESSGDNTVFTVEGNLKVAVPFIGKKIEPEFAKAVKKSLTEELEMGQARLKN